jgi:DNA ligase (NAD+)
MQTLIQPKYDGVSLALTYQDHQLVAMVTRGDGNLGQDITPNAAHMPSIPKTIPESGTVHVRGEIIMLETTFNQFFKDRPRDEKMGIPNARNTASGLIASKSTPQDLQHLSFIAYDYPGIYYP